MPLAIAAIGAAGSLGSGLIGSNASKKAAKTQHQNALQVAGLTNTAVNSANSALGGVYNNEAANLTPYLQAGTTGAQGLMQALAPGGTLAQNFSFDPSQISKTPEYQFQMQQGLQGVNRAAAAGGTLNSGSTLKGLTQYSQGLASTSYQQAYNNALNTFQTNHNNTLGGLLAETGIGQNATGQLNAIGTNYGNEVSGNIMGGNSTIAQALTGGANAQANGQINAANSWSGALGGLGNAASGYYGYQMANQPQYGTINPYLSSTPAQFPNNGVYSGPNFGVATPPFVQAYGG